MICKTKQLKEELYNRYGIDITDDKTNESLNEFKKYDNPLDTLGLSDPIQRKLREISAILKSLIDEFNFLF